MQWAHIPQFAMEDVPNLTRHKQENQITSYVHYCTFPLARRTCSPWRVFSRARSRVRRSPMPPPPSPKFLAAANMFAPDDLQPILLSSGGGFQVPDMRALSREQQEYAQQ